MSTDETLSEKQGEFFERPKMKEHGIFLSKRKA